MNILIIANNIFNHRDWKYGSTAKCLFNILNKQHNISIKYIPYSSVINSSYFFYTYKNVDLKDKYDLIIVCEGKPCKKWTKNGPILWVPMHEFLSGSLWNLICNENWFSIYTPSLFAFNKIKKQNPNLNTEHFQFWADLPEFECKKSENLTIFAHLKNRGWGNTFWNIVFKELKHINFILKINNHADVNFKNYGNIQEVLCGTVPDPTYYFKCLSESDIYICPRIIEGIGICNQEAAYLENLLIYPDYPVCNEYFNSNNGFPILIKNSNQNTKNIMGEFVNPIPEYECIGELKKYINELNDNKELLKNNQKYNKQYVLQKRHDFIHSINKMVSSYASVIPIHVSERVLHIQTCLEGGQGLISCNIASDLKKYYNYHNTFYYLSDQDQEEALISYKNRLNNIDHKLIKNTDEINIDEYDLIFFHWSSSFEKRVQNSAEWYEWIKKLKIPKICLIYDSIKCPPDLNSYYCVPSDFNLQYIPINSLGTFKVPYQVEQDFFEYNENSLDYKNSPFIIGRISRLIERKFDPKFIPICKYLQNNFQKNLSIHLLGDGNYVHKLERDLQYWQIPYKVTGQLYDSKRIPVMKNTDICIYLTKEHEESFCLAVAEYMALGIPIICQDKGALKEVVPEECVCSNYNEIINLSEKLIKDLKFRKNISLKCKIKALEYQPRNITKQYHHIINQIFRPIKKYHNKPKWSIIMPSYNHGKYIKTSILSMLDQKFGDWELLIFNNSSTDNTSEILSKFNDSRIKIFNEEKSYQIQSWKKGIELSQGEYIGFLDADDWLHPLALNYLNEYYLNNPDVICAWTQNERWNEDLTEKIKNGMSEDPYSYGSLIDGLIQNKVIISHFLTCKKESALQIKDFDLTLSTSADRWIVVKLDSIGKLGFLNKKLHRYRFLHPESTTIKNRDEQIDNTFKIIQEALKERNDYRKIQLIKNEFNYDFKIE